MARPPLVALHLGAHKTGTTHIQSRLGRSVDTLRRQGIAHVPVETFRRRLTTRLGRGKAMDPGARQWLAPFLDCERLVLSDENIIGATSHPRGNRLYPEAQRRLEKLLAVFGDDVEFEVFFTVRRYPEYLASRYAESLLHFPFRSFGQYYAGIDLDTVSWLDTLADIRAAGIRRVRVIPYEDLFRDEQRFFDALLGRPGIALAEAARDPGTRRTKFSQEGYDVIELFARRYGTTDVSALVRMLGQTQQASVPTEFMPMPDEQRRQLAERYAAELRTMANAEVAA